MQIPVGALLAGQVLLFVASAALAWLLLRERRTRRATCASLEARLASVEQSSERVALLDRRLAVLEPLDRLRRRWSLGERPGGEGLVAALHAAERAQLLFPDALDEALERVSTLLASCIAHEARERALASGGRSEREEVMVRRNALEQRLRPAIETLCTRMAELAKLPAG